MAGLQEYKCPCCGGAINFDSTSQRMKCPYCDTEFDIDTLAAYDKDLACASDDDRMEWDAPGKVWQEGDEEGLRVYVCKSCAGQIIGDNNMGATLCPYCGSPVVLMGQFSGDLRPDYIIPFKLDKKAATAKLKEHYNKPFVPDAFTDENHIEEIKGIYVPYWVFDTNASGNVRYKATKVRSWQDSRNIYTETSFFSVIRKGRVGFDKIPADASSKMPDDMMESLEPFDFSQAVDFKTAYMAGFLADRYDVTVDAVTPHVNDRVKKSTEDALATTVSGYASVSAEDSSVTVSDAKVSYALYPVWLLNTKWNGNTYTFAMNGQSGKMVGDIPIDKGKITRRFLTVGSIAAVVVFAIEVALHFGGMI